MKLATAQLHITDHAIVRYRERIAITGDAKCTEIVSAIRDSKFLSNGDVLPFRLTRLPRSTYCYNENLKALFVLDSNEGDSFRVVTVYSPIDEQSQLQIEPPPQPIQVQADPKSYYVLTLRPSKEFATATEERDWLIAEKLKIQGILGVFPKTCNYVRSAKIHLKRLEDRLHINKILVKAERYKNHIEQEQARKNDPEYVDFGKVAVTILKELQAIRILLEEKNVNTDK